MGKNNEVSGTITIKALQRNTLKNTINKSKWNSKKDSHNPQESRKKRNREMKKVEKKRKMTDLHCHLSVLTLNANGLYIKCKC